MPLRQERSTSKAIGRSWRLVAVPVIVAALGGQLLAAQEPRSPQTPPGQLPPPAFEKTVEVVGATPIHGLGINRNRIPSNILTATADGLARTGGVSLGEQMNLGLPSVHVNEATTNPFQPDLQFRGFVGSPLLRRPSISQPRCPGRGVGGRRVVVPLM